MVEIRFKTVIFGEGGVGKSTLVHRYVTGIFKENFKMTIGVQFHYKVIKINNMEVHLQIWDFAGENQFKFLLPGYVQGASGGIFMYDITRLHSLNHINEWLDVLKKGLKTDHIQIPLVLVGGKADLEEKRSVDLNHALNLVQSHQISHVFECSSKTGDNVEDIFMTLTNEMLKRANLLKE